MPSLASSAWAHMASFSSWSKKGRSRYGIKASTPNPGRTQCNPASTRLPLSRIRSTTPWLLVRSAARPEQQPAAAALARRSSRSEPRVAFYRV